MTSLRTQEFEILQKELSVLSELKPGFTLSTSTMQPIDHRVISTSFFRWYNGENRDETLDRIQSILTKGRQYYQETKDKTLREQLEKASDGIRNLLVTYSDGVTQNRIREILRPLDDLFVDPLESFLSPIEGIENKKNVSTPILFEPSTSPDFVGSPSPESWKNDLDDTFDLNGRRFKKTSLLSCPLQRALYLNQNGNTFPSCILRVPNPTLS